MKFFNRALIHLIAATTAIAAISCSDSKHREAIAERTTILDNALVTTAEHNPTLLKAASASLNDNSLDIRIDFADVPYFKHEISRPIVEYFMAQLFKEHSTATQELANELAVNKSTLNVTVADDYGTAYTYNFTPDGLRHLLGTKASKLNFNDVRTYIIDILASRCHALADSVGAENAVMDFGHGFATYIFTFEKADTYKRLSTANLKARYIKTLSNDINMFGDYRDFMASALKSVGVDGFRFIYKTAGDKGPELKTTVPWREIL